MARIIWTATAAEDLSGIAEYIARDNSDAAANLVRKILASLDQLADFPLLGRMVSELNSTRYREIIVPPCRIIYRAEPDAVVIL